MIRDNLITVLSKNPGGLRTKSLVAQADFPWDVEKLYVAEALLWMSPELKNENGTWKLARESKQSRIISKIDTYSQATGKKIFRLATALESLPVQEHPTETELKQILEADGRYQLLANAMIKRVG